MGVASNIKSVGHSIRTSGLAVEVKSFIAFAFFPSGPEVPAEPKLEHARYVI